MFVDFEQHCTGLPNVRWMPLQPLERWGELLTMADIHLLPQRADAADLVMPSMLNGMLASSRPVVATARAGMEVANVVAGCGMVVACDFHRCGAGAGRRCPAPRDTGPRRPRLRRSKPGPLRCWGRLRLNCGDLGGG